MGNKANHSAVNIKNSTIQWDANTPHADKFAFRGGFASKVYGNCHQLVAKDHLPKGSTTIKATIKQYGKSGRIRWIGFGVLTESRRNVSCSGWIGSEYQ
jgi:hypothetical protein